MSEKLVEEAKEILSSIRRELSGGKEAVAQVLTEDEFLLRAKRLNEIIPYFFDNKSKMFYVWNEQEKIYQSYDDVDVVSFLLSFLDREVKSKITKTEVKNRFLFALKLVGSKNHPKEPKKTWIKFRNCV